MSSSVEKDRSTCFILCIALFQGNVLWHLLSIILLFSPVQSSDELISCSGPIVTFLKDCHNVVTVGVEVGHYSNTPLLCMLTR